MTPNCDCDYMLPQQSVGEIVFVISIVFCITVWLMTEIKSVLRANLVYGVSR